MPKVNVSLAGVNTEFQPIPDGIYTFVITEAPLNTDQRTGRQNVQPKLKIDSVGEQNGRSLKDYIALHTKEGEPNEPGMTQLKRYFEAAFGKEEVATWTDEDYDPERLKGQRVQGEVVIEDYLMLKKNADGTYGPDPEIDPKTGDPRHGKRNKLRYVVPID